MMNMLTIVFIISLLIISSACVEEKMITSQSPGPVEILSPTLTTQINDSKKSPKTPELKPQEHVAFPPGISRIEVINEVKNVSRGETVDFYVGVSYMLLGWDPNEKRDEFEFFPSGEDYNATVGSHFFKIDYATETNPTFLGRNYVEVTRYSKEELTDWDLRVDVEDHDAYFIYNITYKHKIRDAKRIKEFISSLREKDLKNVTLTMYYREEGTFDPNQILSNITLRDDTLSIFELRKRGSGRLSFDEWNEWVIDIAKQGGNFDDPSQIIYPLINKSQHLEDIDQIKEQIVDAVSKFEFDEEKYGEIEHSYQQGRQLGLEQNIIEELVLYFNDGSRIEVNYVEYSHDAIGTLRINNETYFLGYFGAHEFSGKKVFYNILTEGMS